MRHFAFLFLLFLNGTATYLQGQAFNYHWAQSVGSYNVNHDQATCLISDAAGNVYVSGYLEGSVDVDPGPGQHFLVSSQGLCSFLVKYDANGNFQWGHRIEAGGSNKVNAIALDAVGNIVVAGGYNGISDFDFGVNRVVATTSRNDIFLAKYDPAGGLMWLKTLNSDPSGSLTLKDLAIDGNGNVHVTGRLTGQADFDPSAGTALLSAIGADAFFAKYTASGDYVFARQMAGTTTNAQSEGRGMAIDNSGNIFVSGDAWMIIDFDPGASVYNLNSSGGTHIFLAKYDSTGAFQWAFNAGASLYPSTSNSIVLDAAGNPIIAGYFNTTVDFDPSAGVSALTASMSLGNAFVAKYTSAGALVFVKQIQGTGQSSARSIKVDATGNILLSGYMNGTIDADPGPGITNLTVPIGTDGTFFARFDSLMNLTWAQRLSSKDEVAVARMSLASNGDPLIAGYFSDTTDLDPGPGITLATNAAWTSFLVGRYSIANGALIWTRIGQEEKAGMNEEVVRIVTDAAGFVYTTGTFQGRFDADPGPGTVILEHSGQRDIFFTKSSPAGALIWAKSIGGLDDDKITGLAVDTAGYVYCAGNFDGFMDFDPGPAYYPLSSFPGEDPFILKLSPSGNFVSLIKIEASTLARVHDLKLDANGNLLVAGQCRQNTDFDPSPASASFGASNGTGFFAKYSNTLGYLGAWILEGPGLDEAKSIDVDQLGKMWVFGTLGGTSIDLDPGPGITNAAATGLLSAFVAKYEPNGTLITGFTLSGSSAVQPAAFDLDSAGNLYLTGTFATTSDFDPSPSTTSLTSTSPQPDAFIAKYSSSGSLSWVKQLEGQVMTELAGIQSFPGGGCVVAGNAYGGLVDMDPGPGVVPCNPFLNPDLFFIQLDDAGQYQGSMTTGSLGGDMTRTLWVDEVGNIFAGGGIAGPVDFDPSAALGIVASNGSRDAFLVKFGSQCSTPVLTLSGQSNVTCHGGSDGSAGTSVSGGSGFSFIWAPSGDTTATISGLSAGTYTCIVTNQCGAKDTVVALVTQPAAITATQSATACSSYTWPVNSQTYTSSGPHTAIITNAAGCDSTITLNLTISQPSTATQSATSCNSYTWPVNNQTYTTSGLKTAVLTNAAGCDSTITLNLTIHQPSAGTLTLSGCNSLVVNGQNYTASGTFNQVLSNANGCDSILTLNISITSPNATVVNSGPTLTAGATTGSYLWIDCNSGQAIPNETGQTFTPTLTGSYAVVVNENACLDTSVCEFVFVSGIGQGANQGLQVFPNPSTGQFSLELVNGSLIEEVRVIDLHGRTVGFWPDLAQSHPHMQLSLASGMYLVQVRGQDGQRYLQRLVLE